MTIRGKRDRRELVLGGVLTGALSVSVTYENDSPRASFFCAGVYNFPRSGNSWPLGHTESLTRNG